MQSDLVVTKRVNLELIIRLVNMESQCCVNAQYLRRKCLDAFQSYCDLKKIIVWVKITIFFKQRISIIL